MCRRNTVHLIGWLLVALLLSSQSAGAEQERDRFDVLGIRMGDHFDKVRDVYADHFPPAFTHTVQADLGSIHGTTLRGLSYRAALLGTRIQLARPPRYNESPGMEVLFSAPPNEPKAVAINRQVLLDQPISAARLRQMLVEKYGPYLVESPPGPTGGRQRQREWVLLSWSSDAEGRPQSARDARHCSSEWVNVGGLRWLRDRPSGINDGHARCGFTFVVLMPVGDAITRYSTYVHDANLNRELNARSIAYSRAEAERINAERARQEREALERAPGPPL